jgi:ABC-type amino acid transport system permease subunit
MNLDFSFLNWGVVSSFVLKGLLFSVQLTLIAMVGGIILGNILTGGMGGGGWTSTTYGGSSGGGDGGLLGGGGRF